MTGRREATIAELLSAQAGVAKRVLSRTEPLVLDDPTTVFYLTAGTVDVFCRLEPSGRLRPVGSVGAGAVVFGAAHDRLLGDGLVALAHPGTAVLRAPVQALREQVGDAGFADLLGGWVSLLAGGPHLGDGPAGAVAASGTLEAHLSHAADTALKRATEERAANAARIAERDEVLADRLHRTLADVGTALDEVDLADTRKHSDDPLLTAFRAVGRIEGFTVVEPGPDDSPFDSAVTRIAMASGLRTRTVALRSGWERERTTTLLGFVADQRGERPVVITGSPRGGTVVLDPATGSRVPLDKDLAAGIHPVAYQLYRSLPRDGELTPRRLFAFALRGAKGDLVAIVAMGLLAGLLSLLVPVLTHTAFDTVIPAGDATNLVVLGGGLVLASAGAFAFAFVQGAAITRITNRSELTFQAAVWDWVMSLPVPFFADYTAGELANRVLGVERLRQILATSIVVSVLASIFSVFNVAMMFAYSVPLAVAATAMLAVAAAVTLANGLRQVRLADRLTEVANEAEGLVVQTLQGIAKLRVAGADSRAFARMADASLTRERLTYQQKSLAAFLTAFTAAFRAASFAGIFLLIAYTQWAHVGPADFLAFSAAYGIVLAAVVQFSGQVVALAPVAPLYRALKPLLQARPEVAQGGDSPGPLGGHVQVSGVSFGYDEQRLVLDDLSFTVAPGQFVAVVGPSGSGKSTLMRLLLGFERPGTGSVFYDGKDLARLDVTAVRRQMGVVLQSTRLTVGTLYDNIVGGLNITMNDAWAAASQAGIAADIRAMPMGMQTMVPSGGGSFSGGQAQRIVIARALAGRPRILLFDEATSALDNRTQELVSASLARLPVTRIVIAHRLSTVRDADKILVVDAGKLVESGTYAQLMALDGVFATMARRQLT